MAVEFKDYYRILGVDRKADDKTIKSAYRKLARKYHPDVNKGQDASFKEINEAYEVLSDPEKRRRYDTLGPDWQRYTQQATGQQPGGFTVEYGDAGDFSEFFRTIFGDLGARMGGAGQATGSRVGFGRGGFEDLLGGGMGRGTRRRRGEDVQAGIEITLDEAFHGTRKSLALEMDEPCATCQGSGNVGGKPCASCHGTGWQRARRAGDRPEHDAGRADGRRKRTLRPPARAPDRFPPRVLRWITDGAPRFADRRAPEPGAGAPTANKG